MKGRRDPGPGRDGTRRRPVRTGLEQATGGFFAAYHAGLLTPVAVLVTAAVILSLTCTAFAALHARLRPPLPGARVTRRRTPPPEGGAGSGNYRAPARERGTPVPTGWPITAASSAAGLRDTAPFRAWTISWPRGRGAYGAEADVGLVAVLVEPLSPQPLRREASSSVSGHAVWNV